MTLFNPFLQPLVLSVLMIIILFLERNRLVSRLLPLLALLWMFNIFLWTLYSWFSLFLTMPGHLDQRAWDGLFLGLGLGSYLMFMSRIAFGGEADRKVEQIFFKAALLLGLIVMTVVNFRSLELGYIIFVGGMLLGVPMMYQRLELRPHFNLHVMSSLGVLIAFLLGYNQAVHLELLHWLQSTFFVFALALQYVIIRRVIV